MMQFTMIFETLRTILAPITAIILAYVPSSWLGSLPSITLVAFSLVVLAVGMKKDPTILSLIGIIFAGLELVLVDSASYGVSFGGLFVRDAFADIFMYLILLVSFIVVLSSSTFFGDRGAFHFLLLMAVAGALWVVSATDLVGLFLAWELMSTPTYVLAAFGPNRGAVDGAVKYFVMGMLASMMMLFGIALVYGVTGETDISTLAEAISGFWTGATVDPQSTAALLLAMSLFIISFGFKIGVFPGWMWVPDTYGSADGSVAAFLAGGTKKAGVSAITRILVIGFIIARLQWMPLLVIISILTMIIGNLLALKQNNIMRMLAYSSIAMMGYLFIGLASGTELGISAAIFHAFIHALMKTGAFVIIWALTIKVAHQITFDDLAGLSERAPLANAILTILILSLTGMPLTAGFWSKVFLFQSAVEVGMWWLALIGVLNSVFSLGYYLRVLKYTLMIPNTDMSSLKLARIPIFAAGLCAIGVVFLFIYPAPVLNAAIDAATLLLHP